MPGACDIVNLRRHRPSRARHGPAAAPSPNIVHGSAAAPSPNIVLGPAAARRADVTLECTAAHRAYINIGPTPRHGTGLAGGTANIGAIRPHSPPELRSHPPLPPGIRSGGADRFTKASLSNHFRPREGPATRNGLCANARRQTLRNPLRRTGPGVFQYG
jgi:hypothetical protein